MTATLTYAGTLVVEECYSCHIAFAMPADFQRRARDAGPKMTFYCPLGHGQVYSASETQQLRDRLAAEERRRRNAETRASAAADQAAADQAAAAERSRRAYKGQLTKVRKRIGNGVCPCCNRHFADVQRHMAGQHPGYADGEGQ